MKAPPRPPSIWYRGIIRNPLEGIRVGTAVAFRRSREGGWRVITATRQVLVTDERVAHYVISLRGAGGKPIPLPDQEAVNRHLADIFHGRVLLGKKGPGPYSDLNLARD